MLFARFKAILVIGLTLTAAALTTPSVSSAAPVSSGWNSAAQAGGAINADLLNEVRYGGGRGYGRGYGRGRSYGHRGYGRRGYGRRGYGRRYGYARPHYRRAGFYGPVGYGRPVRCRLVYQQVWTGYGYAVQPVRSCRRW